MPTKYFLFDCETGGGRDKDVSLLTLYGVLLDEKLNVLDSIDLYVAPKDGVYHVEAEGLKKNGISLIEHNIRAKAEPDAASEFRNFVLKHYDFHNQDTLIPAGHNVDFDIAFANKLLPQFHWDRFFSKRTLDTASIARFLQLGGRFDVKNPTLENLSGHFGIPYVNEHTAEGDVKITLEVLKAMIDLIKQ